MRRWYVPLTVVGLAGLGALVLSERGRQALCWVAETFDKAPDALSQWNGAAQGDLQRLRAAINQLSDSLGTAR